MILWALSCIESGKTEQSVLFLGLWQVSYKVFYFVVVTLAILLGSRILLVSLVGSALCTFVYVQFRVPIFTARVSFWEPEVVVKAVIGE